jgi:hypothetical protein
MPSISPKGLMAFSHETDIAYDVSVGEPAHDRTSERE